MARMTNTGSGEALAAQLYAERKSKMNGAKLQSLLLKILVYAAAALTFGALICLIAYILIKGIPNLSQMCIRDRGSTGDEED